MTGQRLDIDLGWGAVSAIRWRPPSGSSDRRVLLLHGGGADSASLSWAGIGTRLAAAGYHVVAPDHPGYGHSPQAPWAATQQRLVTYIGELVDALGWSRYAVGGLSLGGGLALGHLLRRSDDVVAAILLGSYGIMPRLADGPWSTATQITSWALVRTGAMRALTRSFARSPARMERGLRRLVRDPRHRTTELVDEVVQATRGDHALTAFAQWQSDQVAWNRLRTDYTPQLTEVRCPMLFVHGEHDSGVPVARARRAAERTGARLVVAPGAGHWVQRDAPSLTADAVVDFLRRAGWERPEQGRTAGPGP